MTRKRTRDVRCVVACVDAAERSTLYPCTVTVTEAQFQQGHHRYLAALAAAEAGYYHEPTVVFIDTDADWLVAHFDIDEVNR